VKNGLLPTLQPDIPKTGLSDKTMKYLIEKKRIKHFWGFLIDCIWLYSIA